MSNTITIKDPNGNIVCSVENVEPIRSEEKMDFIDKVSLGFLGATATLILAGITVPLVSKIKDKSFMKKLIGIVESNPECGKLLRERAADYTKRIRDIRSSISKLYDNICDDPDINSLFEIFTTKPNDIYAEYTKTSNESLTKSLKSIRKYDKGTLQLITDSIIKQTISVPISEQIIIQLREKHQTNLDAASTITSTVADLTSVISSVLGYNKVANIASNVGKTSGKIIDVSKSISPQKQQLVNKLYSVLNDFSNKFSDDKINVIIHAENDSNYFVNVYLTVNICFSYSERQGALKPLIDAIIDKNKNK